MMVSIHFSTGSLASQRSLLAYTRKISRLPFIPQRKQCGSHTCRGIKRKLKCSRKAYISWTFPLFFFFFFFLLFQTSALDEEDRMLCKGRSSDCLRSNPLDQNHWFSSWTKMSSKRFKHKRRLLWNKTARPHS